MGVTPLLSRAPRLFAKPARSFSRRLQHGVSKDSLPFTTIFLPELKYSFYFFHELAFDSFKLCVLHPTFLSCRVVLFFFARTLLLAFKMGVKNFHHEHSRSRSQRELIVERATIFFDFTTITFFRRITIFMVAHLAFFIEKGNDGTVVPSAQAMVSQPMRQKFISCNLHLLFFAPTIFPQHSIDIHMRPNAHIFLSGLSSPYNE